MAALWSFLALFLCQNAFCVLRFANYYHDHMVLQMAPSRAQIWGYANTTGDTVHVLLNGTQVATATVTERGGNKTGGVWTALLPAQTAGGPYRILVNSKDGHAAIADVLFGDVWVCSGQSNMEFTFSSVYNFSIEFANAAHFPNIRLLHIAHNISNVSLEEPAIQTHWQKPGNDAHTRRFSAVCLLYGMELYPHINRPIGLVETSWGGTPIEVWSSHEALANCTHRQKRAPTAHSVLWNGMVEPILNMTIYGAIWYQGESNAGHYVAYACQFPTMIDDWRARFHWGSQGQTNLHFPFGFVQLAPYFNQTRHVGMPDLRWAQTANYGYVPNPRQPNVFMAVAMDLPDFNSTYGAIHPRDKQDVAMRLALAGRAVAYGESNLDYQGPIPDDYTLMGNKLVIEFDQGNSAVEVRSTRGFEVCCGHTSTFKCPGISWTEAPIVAHDQSTVTIDVTGCHGNTNVVTAVRYAWEMSPCDFKMCAIYDKNNDLPAPPFVKDGPFHTQ